MNLGFGYTRTKVVKSLQRMKIDRSNHLWFRYVIQTPKQMELSKIHFTYNFKNLRFTLNTDSETFSFLAVSSSKFITSDKIKP